MTRAGDSKTPLVKKLGIRPGFRVRLQNTPDHYLDLVQPLPEGVVVSSGLRTRVDLWHLFTDSARELAKKLPKAKAALVPNGMIWVSWPKKSSKVPSDVTEDVVRQFALPLGLVDVKVCAVDEVWSGLKLVIRKELRPT